VPIKVTSGRRNVSVSADPRDRHRFVDRGQRYAVKFETDVIPVSTNSDDIGTRK